MNPEIVSFQYATGMCLLLENVGGSEQNRSVIANVQSDDLWPSRMHAANKMPIAFDLKNHIFEYFSAEISRNIVPNRIRNLAVFGQRFAEITPNEVHCAFLAHPVNERADY